MQGLTGHISEDGALEHSFVISSEANMNAISFSELRASLGERKSPILLDVRRRAAGASSR